MQNPPTGQTRHRTKSGDNNVKTRESLFHVHLISDATVETLLSVARAAAAQYTVTRAIEPMHAMVRAATQARLGPDVARQ